MRMRNNKVDSSRHDVVLPGRKYETTQMRIVGDDDDYTCSLSGGEALEVYRLHVKRNDM